MAPIGSVIVLAAIAVLVIYLVKKYHKGGSGSTGLEIIHEGEEQETLLDPKYTGKTADLEAHSK